MLHRSRKVTGFRYLERKFGDEYRRYKEKVPRYWWRL
jgi:hypothetical protein